MLHTNMLSILELIRCIYSMYSTDIHAIYAIYAIYAIQMDTRETTLQSISRGPKNRKLHRMSSLFKRSLESRGQSIKDCSMAQAKGFI